MPQNKNIGTERISSALGTVNNLGILYSEMDVDLSLVQEMNDKVEEAAQVLIGDAQTFGKQLNLPSPITYSRPSGSCVRDHHADKYDAYWYHPDHLGSSSYISNRDGNISQHMEYLPFGKL